MFYMGVGGLVRGTSFVYKKEKILQIKDLQDFSAEREGFEPPVPLGTPVFKTGVIDHSTISPNAFERCSFSKAMQR